MANVFNTFITSMNNYFNFNGRASRKEYFVFNLLCLVILLPLERFFPTISTIVTLLITIPSLSVTSRRLHDLNFSGWWMLVLLFFWLTPLGMCIFSPEKIPLWITLAVLIFLCECIWLYCFKGSEGSNKYGPDPLK